MSKSLADLRANPPQARPERSTSVCLKPDIVAEIQSLTSEFAGLGLPTRRRDPEKSERPRRIAEGPPPEPPRAQEIRDRLDELIAEMAENEGEMRLRAVKTDGDWRMWVNAHPARGEDEPGYDRDVRVTRGICNADDLIDDLATYAVAWNGEEFTGNDYATIFEPVLGSGDKAEMARTVVAMYESRLDFQQWRSSLSASLKTLSDFSSPMDSASPTGDFTDASPEPSNAATTETGTRSR